MRVVDNHCERLSNVDALKAAIDAIELISRVRDSLRLDVRA